MTEEPINERREAQLYAYAYATVRSQLEGLSIATEYPISSRFARLLTELDASHQGEPPPALPAAGVSLDTMLADLRIGLESMIKYGGDATYLRVTYHLARTIRLGR